MLMQVELHQIANKQRLQLHHMLPDKKKEGDQEFQGSTNYQVSKTTLILLMFLFPTLPLSYWVIQQKKKKKKKILNPFLITLKWIWLKSGTIIELKIRTTLNQTSMISLRLFFSSSSSSTATRKFDRI